MVPSAWAVGEEVSVAGGSPEQERGHRLHLLVVIDLFFLKKEYLCLVFDDQGPVPSGNGTEFGVKKTSIFRTQ